MRRSTRFVAGLPWTAAIAVAVEVPTPSLHIIDVVGAVTAASRPGGRSPGGAVGRREETAVVDFRQVESDAWPGLVKNGNWNSRPMRNHRLDTIRHGPKGFVIPAVWIDS